MKPDDMNTINENGTAFNGNFSPVFLASAFVPGSTIPFLNIR